MFPNVNGSLLTIDDPRMNLLNRTIGWKYNNSIKSSLTILAGSLQSNQTYQFMVYMENRQNSSIQATGYLLVQIEDNIRPMIAIG